MTVGDWAICRCLSQPKGVGIVIAATACRRLPFPARDVGVPVPGTPVYANVPPVYVQECLCSTD
jgi:hypothetical protein